MKIKLIIGCVVAFGLSCAALGIWTFVKYGNDAQALWYRVNTLGPLAIDHVADGDTISIIPRFGKKLSVRLLGINTKEIEHKGRNIKEECWGPEAALYVSQLAENKIAYLDFDSLKPITEDHDRLIGYVYLYSGYWSYWFGWFGWNAIDLNLHLIETGYAEEWLYDGTYTRADEFLAAEKAAKAKNIGGWKACADFKKHPRKEDRPPRKKRRRGDD
jgi:endonuclease YncB( thermonuclease family)